MSVLKICIKYLKIVQKNIALQKDDDIWKCLEELIESSPVAIKKEIIKLLDFENNSSKLKYLLDMYDDDNWEIRNLVIEKLSSLSNFDLIDTNNKIRILFIGLSDKNDKVKQNTKKFFKNYLNFLGIITDKKEFSKDNNDDMAIDEKVEDVTFKTENVKLSDENDEDNENNKIQTVDEKIRIATSPLKFNKKAKIKLSPAILFDKLNFINYYFNPKLSYVFQLVTDALIECSSYDSLIDLYEQIIYHLLSTSNTLSFEQHQSFLNNHSEMKETNYCMLYELLFLQSKII